MKDYYRILGVSRDASDEDIKRAFRRLASQHHPDKGGDKEKFQEVQEAYAVLSDPARRQEYDNPASQVRFNMGGGMPGGFNFEDIFNMFGVNVNMHQHRQQPRISLWIDLEDVARGGPRVISLQVNSVVSNVEINIPPGINDGENIRYAKLSPDGQDLIINYRIKPHAVWHRQNKDVICEKSIDLWDLVLGCEIPIKDLMGNTLMLTIPPRTQPGSTLRMRGRGLPAGNIPGRAGGPPGDILVRIATRLPEKISDDLISAIRREQGQ